jgi:DNA-directed RNA polymerase subunit RPC12/RpoP
VASVPSVNYLCTKCDARLSRETGEPARACERCGETSDVVAPPAAAIIDRCAACGHDQLYFQKDFNRRTGIALVVAGSIFVPWTYGLSLLGVTILDYIVWRLVKDVIVCYQCQAVHRGYPPNPAIKPFDLVIHDRHVYGAAPPGAEEGHG